MIYFISILYLFLTFICFAVFYRALKVALNLNRRVNWPEEEEHVILRVRKRNLAIRMRKMMMKFLGKTRNKTMCFRWNRMMALVRERERLKRENKCRRSVMERNKKDKEKWVNFCQLYRIKVKKIRRFIMLLRKLQQRLMRLKDQELMNCLLR